MTRQMRGECRDGHRFPQHVSGAVCWCGEKQIKDDPTDARFFVIVEAPADRWASATWGVLRAEVFRLEAELRVTDQLLNERNRILDQFECPQHGKGCVPWAIEDVRRMRLLAPRLCSCSA